MIWTAYQMKKFAPNSDNTYARNMLEAMAKKTVRFTTVREFSGGYRIPISYVTIYSGYLTRLTVKPDAILNYKLFHMKLHYFVHLN